MSEFIWLFIIIAIGTGGHSMGVYDGKNVIHQKCVAKYSDMPYNKVQAHCKEILEFKK